MPKQRGFTLVEVMIVVGIIAILASIAFPMYGEYVTRGKIQEATSQLADMRVKMEQYYMDNRRYSLANAADPACGLTAAQLNPPGIRYFTYGCVAANNGQSYTVTATGVATQGMNNFVLTIDQSNVKRTTSVGTGWTVPSPNTCWVQKKGGDC